MPQKRKLSVDSDSAGQGRAISEQRSLLPPPQSKPWCTWLYWVRPLASLYLPLSLRKVLLKRQDIRVIWKTGSGARLPGQIPAFPLTSSDFGQITSVFLCLRFLICNNVLISIHTAQGCYGNNRWVTMCIVPRTVPGTWWALHKRLI